MMGFMAMRVMMLCAVFAGGRRIEKSAKSLMETQVARNESDAQDHKQANVSSIPPGLQRYQAPKSVRERNCTHDYECGNGGICTPEGTCATTAGSSLAEKASPPRDRNMCR